MRESLRPYNGANQINYLCIIATELLDTNSLASLPSLFSGFNAVLSTLPYNAARAVLNARLANVAPRTIRELRLMIDAYRAFCARQEAQRRRDAVKSGVRGTMRYDGNSDHSVPQDHDGFAPRFIIRDDLTVERMWTDIMPTDVAEAVSSLTGLLAPALQARPELADPLIEAQVRGDKFRYEGRIEPLGFVPPSAPEYYVERVPRTPGMVKWADLVAIADRFDRIDVEAGRQSEKDRSWFGRLHDKDGRPTAVLRKASPSGLSDCDGIHLQGLVHLIGLPGAGKTTLMYLLAAYMAERRYQTCFLFPSIEVATAFVETLMRYGVDCGLLFGQGETSRNKHVSNFAAAVSSNNGGFGATRPAARFFATNCALAGFASEEDEDFPHASPPCQSLQQRKGNVDKAKKTLRRCALSSVCGRQHSERNLAETTIWAGHILSLDRQVSRLYTDARMRHFELIGHTFDLLVVDECDGAQSSLDVRGTPIMKLSGDSDSLWSNLLQDLHGTAARGRNAFVAGVTVPTILEMTGRFGGSTERFVSRMAHVRKTFRDQYANMLLTALSILSDMFPHPDEDRSADDADRHYEAREGLERLWDTAAKSIAYRFEAIKAGDDDDEADDVNQAREIEQASLLMRVSVQEAESYYGRLRSAIDKWDRDGDVSSIKGIAEILRAAPGLKSPHDPETFYEYTALLTTVSLLVLQHFGLAPHLRLLNSQGLVGDGVFESRPSKDQLAVLPEGLAGRLSGIRYTVTDDGDIHVAHVGFAGTPRLLPQRMATLSPHGSGGPTVLFASATSLLEQSPSFHVNYGPDYVLQRPNAGDGWRNSRYFFTPKRDPNEDRPLFFSGERMSRREQSLKAMVDQLLRGGALSDVELALKGNDVVNGVGRKAAFVVNSYEQCTLIYKHIVAAHPRWHGRVRYLMKSTVHGVLPEHAVTAAEIERLGADREWDLLIFPMNAVGRGVNIVYQFGERAEKAMIGSMYFLTRPHPRGDSLQLIQGIIGRASEEFDRRIFNSTEEALRALKEARHETSGMIKRILRMTLSMRSLGKFARPFVADLMVIILQTIGRAMRGDCPAFVYFVDAAWASRSAYGEADTERTSMLVMMQNILHECLNHPDPATRECYENLYQSFHIPLSQIEGLNVK